MISSEKFLTMLGKYTQATQAGMDDVLFGTGLDLSSIGFTEFIMALEEEMDIEIDTDALDASIKTVGQLYAKIATMV